MTKGETMTMTLKELEQHQDKDVSCINDFYDTFGFKFLQEIKDDNTEDITLILDDEYQLMAWSMDEEAKVVLDMYKGHYNDGGSLYFMGDESIVTNDELEELLIICLKQHF